MNIFDQFDLANPFDQFDEPTLAGLWGFLPVPGMVSAVAKAFGLVEATKDALRAGLMTEADLSEAINSNWALNAEALREALAGGLSEERVEELKANPTPAMRKSAKGKRWRLADPLGKSGKRLEAFAVPALQVVMPFLRAPVKIIRLAAERSAFAPLFKQLRDELRGTEPEKVEARIGLSAAVASARALHESDGFSVLNDLPEAERKLVAAMVIASVGENLGGTTGKDPFLREARRLIERHIGPREPLEPVHAAPIRLGGLGLIIRGAQQSFGCETWH
jgi:hypothetical protein